MLQRDISYRFSSHILSFVICKCRKVLDYADGLEFPFRFFLVQIGQMSCDSDTCCTKDIEKHGTSESDKFHLITISDKML